MQGCANRPAWRSCISRVAQSYGLRNRRQIAQATSRVAQSWKLRKRGCAILEFAQAKFRNPSCTILVYAIRRSCGIGLYSLTRSSRGKLSQTSQATRQCLHVCAQQGASAHRPSSLLSYLVTSQALATAAWMSPSATPATQKERGCRQVPHLPPKVPRRHGRPTPAKCATRRSQVP